MNKVDEDLLLKNLLLEVDYDNIKNLVKTNKMYRSVYKKHSGEICKKLLENLGFKTEENVKFKRYCEILDDFDKLGFNEKVIESDNLNTIKFLIKNDFDAKMILETSAKRGNLKIVKYLVKRGVKLGDSILYSFKNNHFEVLSFLLKATKRYNDKLMIFNIKKGRNEIVRFLIESKDADVHYDNNKPLLIASGYGNLDIIKFLLKNGVKINCENNKALMMAAEKGKLEVVSFLIKECKKQYPDENIPCLNDALIKSGENAHEEVLKYLIKWGADIHVNDDYILRYNGQVGNLKMVKLLLSLKANIHADNDFIFHVNVEKGNLEMVKYLYKRGIKVAYEDLEISIEKKHYDLIRFFISTKEVFFNVIADLLMEPIIIGGDIEMVKILYNAGVKFNKTKAIKLSEEYSQEEIANYLKSTESYFSGILSYLY